LSSNRKELNIATHSSTDLEISSKMNRLVTKMGSTTSIVVAGTFFAVLAYKRDAFMLTFWIGSILNGISSKILKRILNQSRPVGYIHDDSVKVKPSDNGMPSSHAMSLGFIGTYTVLGLWEVVGGGMNGIILSLLLSSYSIISLAYRVKSNLHTMDQILVGSCFGIINSLLWRSLALGTCELLPSFNMMDLVKTKLLPESGIMPITGLIIPAAVGVVLVGSFERRVSNWIKKIKKG
jgi:membrane-associated phospholipid phosphatase